jgi:drug/metabolite transporter (DMT)-like permease
MPPASRIRRASEIDAATSEKGGLSDVSILALVLVLSSAITHSTWNLLAKRVEGGAVFVWLFGALATVIYLPVVAVDLVVQGVSVGGIGLLLMIASATLHTGYFVMLSRGYGAGDLSLVYPLARGTGPLLATAAAIVLFGERPHPIVLAGAVLVAGGAVILGVNPLQLLRLRDSRAVVFALTTGAFIAAYTLVDKQGVSSAGIHPIVFNWVQILGCTLWLSPVALGEREKLQHLWRVYRREALGISILMPLSYILVLSALVFSPVSYVAPAREIGVLFGAIMGFHFLGEGNVGRRLSAATVMVTGIILLAV